MTRELSPLWLQRLTFWVGFYSVRVHVPIFCIDNANRNEHAQACRSSTGLFEFFETELHSNSSKKNEGVFFYVVTYSLNLLGFTTRVVFSSWARRDSKYIFFQ